MTDRRSYAQLSFYNWMGNTSIRKRVIPIRNFEIHRSRRPSDTLRIFLAPLLHSFERATFSGGHNAY